MLPDKIHYGLGKILGYQLPFNLVVSCREAGKSTATWLHAFKWFLKGRTSIVLRRLIQDITDVYIGDIEEVINKFQPDDKKVKLIFKKGAIKDGIVDVLAQVGASEPRPFFRVVALSVPMMRIKSLMYPNLKLMIFDEFIVNIRLGEKYLPNEVFKWQEIVNTFQREVPDGLRCIFLGNPYSLYNPYFAHFGFDLKKIKPGTIQVKGNAVVECYEITQELRDYILARNPLYEFDDSYTKYAFNGEAINDTQIRVKEKLPPNYSLRHIFLVENHKLLVYRNNEEFSYWIGINDDYQTQRRDIITLDVNSLVEGTVLLSPKEKITYVSLVNAFRNRYIEYKSIEESYLFESVFQQIS